MDNYKSIIELNGKLGLNFHFMRNNEKKKKYCEFFFVDFRWRRRFCKTNGNSTTRDREREKESEKSSKEGESKQKREIAVRMREAFMPPMWSCWICMLTLIVHFPPQSRQALTLCARTSLVHTFMNRSQSMKTRFFLSLLLIPFRLPACLPCCCVYSRLLFAFFSESGTIIAFRAEEWIIFIWQCDRPTECAPRYLCLRMFMYCNTIHTKQSVASIVCTIGAVCIHAWVFVCKKRFKKKIQSALMILRMNAKSAVKINTCITHWKSNAANVWIRFWRDTASAFKKL